MTNPVRFSLLAFCAACCWTAPAFAQNDDEPTRIRVVLGAQLVPSFTGADDVKLQPLWDIGFTDADKEFEFEAFDEGFGLPLLRTGNFAFGPAGGFEGSRKAKDVGIPLDKVDATFELGAFAEYQIAPAFRVRAEGRKGLGGHDGWVGVVSADYIARDGDDYLFSIGPRLTFSDATYHRAYFGVTPDESAATGLAAYRPGGGLQAVGATAGFLYQFSPSWGLYSYAKYDRLVGEAADSPIVRTVGSRDQFAGGLGLSYTFNMNIGL